MKAFLLGFLLLPLVAVANPEASVPSKFKSRPYLESGYYGGSDGGYLSGVRLKKWAEDDVMTGTVSYGGYRHRFEVTLRHDEGNRFVGQGEITQRWEGGWSCPYRMKVELFSYQDEQNGGSMIYVRHYTPNRLYTTWDIYGKGCPPVTSGYAWKRDPNPYYLK